MPSRQVCCDNAIHAGVDRHGLGGALHACEGWPNVSSGRRRVGRREQRAGTGIWIVQ